MDVLDPIQLTRIEAVHRGFLYQHLYSVGCLLLAQKAGVDSVTVELDEDIELHSLHERVYVQVKTRLQPIMPSDLSEALLRFEVIRKEHANGRRQGRALFIVVANQALGPTLKSALDNKELSPDLLLLTPESPAIPHSALPPAWNTLAEAASWCISQAEELNFGLLSPDSLIWKLAGLVQLAATGSFLNKQHAFRACDLPALFEQVVVQLQDFPAPPPIYRPQKLEPALSSSDRIRIICGLSGAGKTAWAAQSALHTSDLCAYYDTGDLPGPALAAALVRELSARFASRDKEGLRKILLPGATGIEALRSLDIFMGQQKSTVLVVLDNAHRIPAPNLRDVLNATKTIQFVLLCQPHDNISELEAIMGITRETLLGWDLDTVAAAVNDLNSFATAIGYEQLRSYTGGFPLYVESAAKIAKAEYQGDIDKFCTDLQQQLHSTDTAQEVILSRVYQGFETSVQDALALFSLADIGLRQDEISAILIASFNVSPRGAAILLKKMRATGTVDAYGNQTLKVHDAIRALGLQHLELLAPTVKNTALLALKELLMFSLQENRDTSRMALLTQIFIKLNDVMTLIALSGEELFHEMGITVDILASLEAATLSDTLEPVHRFWALDGLVFSELRQGPSTKVDEWLEAMRSLLEEHRFGYSEEVAYAMKKILCATEYGDVQEIERIVAITRPKLPNAEHERIFDYNYAIALWKLRRFRDSEALCIKVIDEYYDVLGIRPTDVMGRNAPDLWKIIKRPDNVQDHLKHLADALELLARNCDAQHKICPFGRIHAMKFYDMAVAPESLVRLGQDLADEFVGRKDYEGAREVMEAHVLPVVAKAGLVNRMVQVRSQYAVILGLCGRHDDAANEMRRLEPYVDGLTQTQRMEIENQKNQIELLAYIAAQKAVKESIREDFGPVGRNKKCPCGSGLKFKKCHGI